MVQALDVTALCEFPMGVVDVKNDKVYYSLWGDFEKKGTRAGDCLMGSYMATLPAEKAMETRSYPKSIQRQGKSRQSNQITRMSGIRIFP